MKDECTGTLIAECVCLRPKMYSILKADEEVMKKVKEVKKNVVKKQILHEQCKETLFSQIEMTYGMNILRSEKHEIFGMRVNKTSLWALDLKRWIAEDGANTNAFGYNPPLTEEKEEAVWELVNEAFRG